MSLEAIDVALVDADPPPGRPPLPPTVLETSTGVSYFRREKPY